MARMLVMIAGLLGLTGVGVAAAFVAQNAARTTQLSLNLGFMANELKSPISVMALVGGAFVLGGLLSAAFFIWSNWGVKSKVRALQRQLAVADAGDF